MTVGAFNVASGKDNKPLSFHESLQAVSSFDLSVDDLSDCITAIKDSWNQSESGGTFGSASYSADTDWEWLNGILNFLSSFFCTIISLVRFAFYLIRDIVKMIVASFTVLHKLLFGVPA